MQSLHPTHIRLLQGARGYHETLEITKLTRWGSIRILKVINFMHLTVLLKVFK